MASRLAKKKKEEEQLAPASRRRQAQVRAMVEAPQVQAQPKPKPQPKPNLSNSIKETLNKPLVSRTEVPNTSALDPTIGKPKDAVVRFDPIANTHRVEDILGNKLDTSPAEVKKVAATTPLPEKPKTTTTKVIYEYNPATQTRERKVVTVDTTTPTTTDKVETWLKQQEEQKQALQKAYEDRTNTQEFKDMMKQNTEIERAFEERKAKVGLTGKNVSEEQLAAYEKDYNSTASKIVRGLTKAADVIVADIAPIVGGPAGVALAQVYKAYAPEGSEYYQNKSFGDKTVDLITDMTKDKAKDVALGSLKTVGNAIQAGAKGFRQLDKKSGNILERAVVPTQRGTSKIAGGKSFPEGSNIRGAQPSTPSTVPAAQPLQSGTKLQLPPKQPATVPKAQPTRIGPLPRGKQQAPQRLQAQRTDVIISQRPQPRGIRR